MLENDCLRRVKTGQICRSASGLVKPGTGHDIRFTQQLTSLDEEVGLLRSQISTPSRRISCIKGVEFR
jgi:hypothetical protein